MLHKIFATSGFKKPTHGKAIVASIARWNNAGRDARFRILVIHNPEERAMILEWVRLTKQWYLKGNPDHKWIWISLQDKIHAPEEASQELDFSTGADQERLF